MRLPTLIARLGERPWHWAVPLTIVIALAGTGDIIFREDVRRAFEVNGDIQSILRSADGATAGDVLRWWTGVWIERDSPYYRPLASMLFYAEYLAFGRQWRPYCVVSLLIHVGVCVLMLLLVARLFDHWPERVRVVPGVLAAAIFSIPCETHVELDRHWGNRGIARGILPYWPAQTDMACLLLSLASLVLFDRWLQGGRRRNLAGAIAAFIAALLFKEHAAIVPLLAALVAVHRGRQLKLVALVGAAGLVGSGGFLLVRGALVPEAWSPQFKGLWHIGFKAGAYLSEPAVWMMINGQEWAVISAVLVSTCVGIALWKPQWVYVYIFGPLVALFLPPQLFEGNLALPTIPIVTWALVRMVASGVGLILVWEARRRVPSVVLLACVLIAHLPILHVTGPHYYYWPVAWWSMLNAALLVALPGALRAASERAKAAPVTSGPGASVAAAPS